MPFVPAKCTQCGADLTVDNGKDAAICSACGTPFIVEKAIQNYKLSVENLAIQNADLLIETADAICDRIDTFIQLRDHEHAYEAMEELIKKYPMDYRAWMNKVRLLTDDFQKAPKSLHDDIISCFKSANAVATEAQKKYIYEKQKQYELLHKSSLQTENNSNHAVVLKIQKDPTPLDKIINYSVHTHCFSNVGTEAECIYEVHNGKLWISFCHGYMDDDYNEGYVCSQCFEALVDDNGNIISTLTNKKYGNINSIDYNNGNKAYNIKHHSFPCGTKISTSKSQRNREFEKNAINIDKVITYIGWGIFIFLALMILSIIQ